jgi:lipopolysaccharide/colanic/teichoic acid biosynthesis glycosyltransferase
MMYPVAKRAMDLCGAFIGVVIFSPVILVVAIAIAIDSGFPILFRQRRVGQHGKIFEILKFRTMQKNADSDWAQESDPRVTRVGRFLRRTSLDELPQFGNVLLGNMSLVGPRPEMESYANEFARTIPEYGTRHRMKPGITGYAQVYALRTYAPSEIAEILKLDLAYVHQPSLLLDIQLVCKTATGFLFQDAR